MQKRRPALTALIVKGLPRIIHQGAIGLPLDKNLDNPSESETRAASKYLYDLHYWYREQTMNYASNLTEGKLESKRIHASMTTATYQTTHLPPP